MGLTPKSPLAIQQVAGFSMIELLMVMMITSILGSVMLTNFLDFRKEAKVAVLQQNLTAIRIGIKNQRMQAKLRCNYNYSGQEEIGIMGMGLNENYFFGGALWNNDITIPFSFNGVPMNICTPEQLPNPEERKFVQGNAIPYNPFTKRVSSDPILYVVDALWMGLYGNTPCGVLWCSMPETGIDWIFDTTTGEIHPCSNTPGINECNF